MENKIPPGSYSLGPYQALFYGGSYALSKGSVFWPFLKGQEVFLVTAAKRGNLRAIKHSGVGSASTLEGINAFYIAAREGRLKVVKYLYESLVRNKYPNNEEGILISALHLAVKGGHFSTAEYLISLGPGLGNEFLFGIAVGIQRFDLAELLYKNGIFPKNTEGQIGTEEAKAGNLAGLKYLASRGFKFFPSQEAISYKHLLLLKYLISHRDEEIEGAELDKAALQAVDSGNLEALDYLVSKGADISVIPSINKSIDYDRLLKYLFYHGSEVCRGYSYGNYLVKGGGNVTLKKKKLAKSLYRLLKLKELIKRK